MGALEEIKHVVVLMLENHSFDHVLGYLKLPDPNEALDGLIGQETVPVDPQDPASELVPVSKATRSAAYVTDPDPGHEFDDVTLQLFGQRTVPTTPTTPTNNGFVASYAGRPGPDGRPIGAEAGKRIMRCLDPTLLPVLTKLAQNFVVCDHWFSSVPGPTWPNRFYVHGATSNGFIESPTTAAVLSSQLWGSAFRMRTIYENLLDQGHTWKIYFHDVAQAFALRNLHRYVDLFQRFDDPAEGGTTFLQDAMNGTLPNYCFIEPQYFSALGNPANDDHPPHNLVEGERLIAAVYDALRTNEDVWQRCLFVLVYDEHGGFYDHEHPPAAKSPDSVAASNGFAFDRLGVRVPAMLISPWVGRGKVDHTVYDHSSLLATVKLLFGLPAFLTKRDGAARTFERNFLGQPRGTADTPANLSILVPRAPVAVVSPDDQELSEHQRSLHALATVLATPRTEHDAARDVAGQVNAFLRAPEAP